MATSPSEIVIREKVSAPTLRALPRTRITSRLEALGDAGVGMIHGPAGVGKTTAMAQMAAAWTGHVGWVRLDHGDADSARLIALINAALGLNARSTEGIDGAIAAIEAAATGPTLLVLDDLHSIAGSPAEADIWRLIRYRPTQLRLLVASRYEASLPATIRLESPEPLLIDFEDLRFRLWEVDELIRHHHEIPITPADLTLLCRYTDGWAAALRLFSVASRDAPPAHRRRLITGLGTNAAMAHDYLSTEVLALLPPDHRELLVATAVFEHLTPARCDALLHRTGTSADLRAIAGAGLFCDVSEPTGTYRCHDLLRTYLLAELTSRVGQQATAQIHRSAAILIEEEGAPGEAIRCYARGGDLDAIRRVLDSKGDQLSNTSGRWIDVLPKAIREQDPFVVLTNARQMVRQGDLAEARRQYRRAVELFAANDSAARSTRTELRLLEGWLSDTIAHGSSPVARTANLLRAEQGPPRREQGSLDISCSLDRGVEVFFAGQLAEARRVFAELELSSTGFTSAIAGLCRMFVGHLMLGVEGCPAAAMRRLRQASKELDAPALDRVLGSLSRGSFDMHDDPLIGECERSNDQLGAGTIHLVGGIALLHRGEPDHRCFDEAAAAFDGGHYRSLALLARALGSLASAANGRGSGDPPIPDKAARHGGSLCQTLLSAAALWRSGRASSPTGARELVELGEPSGLGGLFAAMGADHTPNIAMTGQAPCRIQVLGHFGISRGTITVPVDLTPQHLEVLALFAVEAGSWLHSDRLAGTFWADKDSRRARHSLQVAVSKVRGELEAAGVGSIERDGQRYRLAPSSATTVDVVELREYLERSGGAELDDSANAIESALASYGEPVADLGAVSWAVDVRRDLRLELSRRAERVAVRLHELGDRERAADIATKALALDPAADPLWRIAIEDSGRARSRDLKARYELMLADLDIGAG